MLVFFTNVTWGLYGAADYMPIDNGIVNKVRRRRGSKLRRQQQQCSQFASLWLAATPRCSPTPSPLPLQSRCAQTDLDAMAQSMTDANGNNLNSADIMKAVEDGAV